MKNDLALARQYAEDVRDGKIVVNRYIKLAIDRYYNDLLNAEKKGWFFSDKAAQKALSYFDFLVLTKTVTRATVPPEQINPDGTIRFQLAPWQAFLIANIFGWKRLDNKKRRFKEVYVEIPKKNGKSTLASGIASYMLIMDKEAGPEVYFGAYTRDQASICFSEAVSQIKDSKELKSVVKIFKYSVVEQSKRGIMMAVSNDGNNTEGKNSSCAIIDEYHVHKTDKVKDSLQTGMSARVQPLMFVITTAGYNKQGPCYLHRGICIQVLEGYKTLDHVLIMIFGIDEGDDWKDEKNWIKANPTLGVTVQMLHLREEFEMALLSGSKEVDFKTKRLNRWVDAETTWLASELWDAGKKLIYIDHKKTYEPYRPDRRERMYIGVDLGRTSDISAVAFWFPEIDYLMHKYYCAEEAAEYASRQGVFTYKQWIKDGYLQTTPGRITDYAWIRKDILKTAQELSLKKLGLDPYGAQEFRINLSDELGTIWVNRKGEDGKYKPGRYPVVEGVRQGFLTLGPATKLFEEKVIGKMITHDANPITAWMLGNVQLDEDAAGNIKPTKAKSLDKIDGITASLNAFVMASEWDEDIKRSTGIAAW
jgi:phage terminase large subunit-like protein